jgi:hypothetical protein
MSEMMPNDHMDPMWKTHMETLMKRTRSMEVKQIIDEALWRYYFEKGMEVPQWRRNKDPQWWTDYLNELNFGE